MDILPTWVVMIAAFAVGLSPRLAILSARSIARLLHRLLWPRPEVASRSGPEPSHGEPAGFSATRGRGAGTDGFVDCGGVRVVS
jgi:hypothetical protein